MKLSLVSKDGTLFERWPAVDSPLVMRDSFAQELLEAIAAAVARLRAERRDDDLHLALQRSTGELVVDWKSVEKYAAGEASEEGAFVETVRAALREQASQGWVA